MSDAREALVALLNGPDHAPMSAHDPRDGSCQSCPWPLYEMPPEDIADAILSKFDVTPKFTSESTLGQIADALRPMREAGMTRSAVEFVVDQVWFDVTPRENGMEWEYGVKWGDEPDDSRPTLCESRAHAESRAAASHGDKIVRRTPARTIPAGEWEEVSDE